MFEKAPNGFFARDMIIFNGLSQGGYVSKGFIFQPPDLTNVEAAQLNGFQDQISLLLASLGDNQRLQVQFFCDSDYRKELLRYQQETQKMENAWTRRSRNERFARYWQLMENRQLRRQKLILYVSRKIESSPKGLRSEAALSKFYDALLIQLEAEFAQVHELLLRIFSGQGARIIPMSDADHFIGEDTRMTREFYPLRLKIHATMVTMARSGWVGWPSFQFLHFFNWCFGETEQAVSRKRELLADQKAAALTSPRTAANALVRFQVATEAFQRGLADAIKNKIENPLNVPLQTVVQEKLAADTEFWTQLFEKRTPHPLDSHPPLNIRLGALGQNISVDDARNLALTESESAYAKWFSTRDALFTNLAQQAQTVIGKLRLAKADYATQEGKAMLDQHFPEKKWRYKQSGLWAVVVLLGLVVAGCLAGAIFINDIAARVMFAVFGVLPALGITLAWKRHRHGELTLNAQGIFYSGWTRPLHFQEIEKTFARRSYSNVILSFRLKDKQPPIWKCSIVRAKTKGVTFSLSGLEGKAVPTAQTILRYLARQTEPADPAVKPAKAN